MKKSALFLLVLTAFLILTGCIDVVHYISKDITGDTEVYFKAAVSKAVFQMAESMGGGGETSEEPVSEGPDMNMDGVREQFPQWIDVSFDTIDNEAESGFSLRYAVDKQRQVTLEDTPPLFPVRTQDGFVILLPAQEKEESSESAADENDQMGSLFLASSHYKIIISKKVATKIQSAELTVGDENYPVPITNLEDLFVLEIPFLPWFLSAGQTCTVRLKTK